MANNTIHNVHLLPRHDILCNVSSIEWRCSWICIPIYVFCRSVCHTCGRETLQGRSKMSVTILIPVDYAFIRDNEGNLVLHPSIKCKPVIIESNGLIKVEPTFQFTIGDGYYYQVEFTKEYEDAFFNSSLVFTGFYSTALSIIKELNVSANDVEWVN